MAKLSEEMKKLVERVVRYNSACFIHQAVYVR